ncbi:MAG: glycosyltransferase family 1 protein [bacterium]|nr:glycosyltransferase family 1 protein [bacterium]
MVIGIDCHNLEGKRTGMGRYLSNLLREWSKLGVGQKFILYFKDRTPDDISKSSNFESKILKSKSTAFFVHCLLPKAAEKDGVDLFFSPSYILPLKISKKIRTAVTIHDISYAAHPEWFSWQNNILLRFVSKKSAQRADIILTPSEFTKKEILKHYQVNPDKIFVVPLAAEEKFRHYLSVDEKFGYCSFAGFEPESGHGLPAYREERRAKPRSRLAGANEESKKIIPELLSILNKYKIKSKFIFYIGAIFNRRFLPECIEAFKQIAKKFPEHQFLISGTNYTHPFIDIDYIIKKANEDIGREAILKTDYVDESDLVYLYNLADLFIWLSSYEGFGLPPLEALACGTPVITTKMGSLAEAVGESAIFINNPEDTKEISGAMEEVLSDERLSNELTKKGLKQAQKFSWGKTAEKTLEFLNHGQK